MKNDLHQLNGELAGAMRSTDPDGQRLDLAAGILRDDRAAVQSVLRAIASEPDLAATIARDSYWHANGFAKLVLHRNAEPRFQLRLHVWGAEREFGPSWCGYENIHTHRWEFASVVLCGALDTEEYEEVDLGEPKDVECDKFEYQSPSGVTAGELRPVSRCGLRRTRFTEYETGKIHYCHWRSVHRVVPVDSALTATIFVQGPTRVASAFVYQETDREVIQDTGASISPREVTSIAAATLDAMHEREL